MNQTDSDPDYIYGGLSAGIILMYIMLMWLLRDEWRMLTEKTIRATAGNWNLACCKCV